MKKVKNIILLIILIVIVSGITAYAVYNYRAEDVKYTEEKTVAEALNELYERTNLTVAESTSKGVFNVPEGIKTAYVIYESSTSGNIEYKLSISGDNVIESSLFSNKSGYGQNLWTELKIYKLRMNGKAGVVNCSASGANGTSYGYMVNLIY